jgi:TetR/AcrR family transcriptional regulator, tetracycline repressor protein
VTPFCKDPQAPWGTTVVRWQRPRLIVVPARRFDPADFVDAAIALLEADGMPKLTLKAVGDAIGADATAVYRHFSNKEALVSAMVDRVLAEVVDGGSPDDDPRTDLSRIARDLRRVLLAYPLLAKAIVGTEVIAPNAVRLSQRVIDDLTALGLSGDTLVRSYQMIENFVLGACTIDGDGGPDNWEIRRGRYALLGDQSFADAASSVGRVAALSEAAYLEGVRVLIDAAHRDR